MGNRKRTSTKPKGPGPPLEHWVDEARLTGDLEGFGRLIPLLEEIERRRCHPLWNYQPDDHELRNQLGFHCSEAPIRLVYGGNQSGKSHSIAQEIAWWLTGTHPYIETPDSPRIYCLSAFYKTVQEGIWRHLAKMIPEWVIAAEGATIDRTTLPSWRRLTDGAQIDFLSAEGREDARRKAAAAEIDLAVIDEEIDGLLWEELMSRRLTRGGKIIVGATLVRSEPWCCDLENRAKRGDPTVHMTRLDTERAAEVGHVSKAVVEEMKETLPEEELAVRLHGHSRSLEDLVYPEFRLSTHTCDPFKIPEGWTRYCALDPGWRTFAVLWAAVSPDDHYYIYREIYAHRKHYREVAHAIMAAEGFHHNALMDAWTFVEGQSEEVQVHWIDPSAFGHHESGELKVGSLISQYGVPCIPARNDVEAGITMCRRDLHVGLDGLPKMRVFNTCTHFISECQGYRRQGDSRDLKRGERPDSPIKRRDHTMDCWKYMSLGGLVHLKGLANDRAALRELQNIANHRYGALTPEDSVKRWQERVVSRPKDKLPPHPGGLGCEY
jgi:hypothetical protein